MKNGRRISEELEEELEVVKHLINAALARTYHFVDNDYKYGTGPMRDLVDFSFDDESAIALLRGMVAGASMPDTDREMLFDLVKKCGKMPMFPDDED